MLSDVLVEKLIAAEALYGEEGVAERCGVKLRMYQLFKARKYHLSCRALRAIVRNFPGLSDDVIGYLSADAEPAPLRPAEPASKALAA